MPIVVDDRQVKPSSSEWADMLVREGLEAYVERLFIGDFMWHDVHDTTWYVEHKSIRDFVTSLDDERLRRFVQTDLGHSVRKAVLLAWDGRSLPRQKGHRAWDSKHIEKVVGELSALHGIVVIRGISAPQAARTLAEWYKWTQQEEHRVFDKTALPTPTSFYLSEEHRDKVRTLMSFPGVGELRALAILEYYGGSLYKALKYVSEWNNVDGIGPKIIEKAERHLA